MNSFDQLTDIDSVLNQNRKEKQVLSQLLDKQRDKKDHLLAVRISMGATKRSFVTGATLEWVAQKVRFATELPIFKEHRDQHGNISAYNKLTVEILQQRKPDWRRQYPMTMYLARRRNHKFPPILLAVSQEWVDNPKADQWDANGRALSDSISAQTLDSEGLYYDINISATDWVYALDGQHRLMAIKGLNELVTQGQLFPKKQDSSSTNKDPITPDEIVDSSNGQLTHADLQALLAEGIGMELIPAVLKGETRTEALRRLRAMFVHVNRTAKPLSAGELALLDEDNGFAVAARFAMVEHPLLRNRVDVKKGQLSETSENFTTLETLETVAREYLYPKYWDWRPEKHSQTPIRPDEQSLDDGCNHLIEYFDHLATLPSHKEMLNAGNDPQFPSRQRKPGPDGEANILFRPIGQAALATAVGILVNRAQHPMKLGAIIETLAKKEKLGLLKYDNHATPWYGPAVSPVTGKINRNGTQLCAELFVHLLGGGTPDEQKRNELREKFAESRRISDDNNSGRDLNGKTVRLDEIDLPTPW
jgi:hypothetical protein